MLLVETVQDLLQGKAALIACRRAMANAGREVPVMIQVTVETTGRLLLGSEIGAALTTLEAMHPDVIGLNCATGPSEMTEHLRYLAQHGRTFLSCLPNAGLPSVVDGREHYDLTPDALADAHERFVTDFGLNIVGGCCGTTPAHLRAVVERIGTRAPTPRTVEYEPACASIYSPVTFHQDSAFLAIGERMNANSSKKFKNAMIAGDWDITPAARQGAGEGRRARARRLRRLRRPRRHRRHGRDREPGRDPGGPPAGARLHRAAGARGGAPAHRRQGRAQLRQPRRGRGAEGSASTA